MSDAMLFTNREGEQVQMEEIKVPYSLLASLYRLQEDYESRGDGRSMRFVVETAISDGINYRRNVWTQGDKSRAVRTIEKKYDGRLSEICDNPNKFQPEDIINLLKAREDEKVAARSTKR